MATRVRVSTKGLEDSLERLAGMGADIDAVIPQALTAGGEVLLAGMKQRVPKDTHNLENSLSMVGPKKDGNLHSVEVGLISVSAETARYGNALEYGTSSMGAQSYIRSTADEDKGKAAKAMRDVLEEELAK